MAIAVQSVPLYCSFIQYTGSSPGWDVIMVLKSSRPSLPLKKAPPFSEPLRYKVGGPSKVCARLCGLGPPGGRDSQLLVDVRMVVVLDLVGCINGSRGLMTLEK